MQSLFLFAIALLLGYYASAYFTTPLVKDGASRPNRLPSMRFRNIEVLPNLRIHIRKNTFHFHHWFYLTVIIVGAAVLYDNLMHFTTIKAAAGASVGGIIQGLTYPDRFKFKHPRDNESL